MTINGNKLNMNPTLDKFDDFVAVMESAAEPQKIDIIGEGKNPDGSLSFLRFYTCLQTFGSRNRNRRLWLSKFMRIMLNDEPVQELLNHGGVPGEAGHPVPDTGQVTIERILTIDPNNVSHVIKKFDWKNDDWLGGEIETIDDGNGPGDKLKKNIIQGLPISFSTRSVIPQRKNPDGTIDQLGPGRYVCSDRVFVPSHKEAYKDDSVPVKNICKKDHFDTVMESFVSFTVEHSDKINRIVDKMQPAMESAAVGESGMVTIPTKNGYVGIYPELKYRNDLRDAMSSLLGGL